MKIKFEFNKKIIIRVSALFCVLIFSVFLSGCIPTQQPVVKHSATSIQLLSLTKAQVNLTFDADNPNPIGIHDANLSYQFLLAGKKIIDNSAFSFSLPASQSSSFTVPINIDIVDAFDSLNHLVSSVSKGQKSIPYVIEGSIGGSLFMFPISMPVSVKGDIPIPELPSFSLKDVSLDVSNWTVNLLLSLDNSNDFPVSFDTFSYTASLLGKEVFNGRVDDINVSAGEKKDVKIKFAFSPADLGTQLIYSLSRGKLDFKLDGSFKADGHELPVELSKLF